ncbi:MAG: ABC transporter permease [Deinococcaceae bacterium]
MLTYIFRRLLQFIPTFILGTILTFAIIQAAPGDMVDALKSNPRVTAKELQRQREMFDLDKPVPVQYFTWIKNMAQGNLGQSFQFNQPVKELIKQPIVNSLILVILSTLILYAVAIPIGVYGALKPYGFWDRFFSLFAYFGLGLPSFFFALLVIFGMVTLKQNYGWDLPISGKSSSDLPESISAFRSGWDVFLHALAPSAILVLRSISSESRYIRGQMLEVLGQDFVRTAKAKGLSTDKVVYKHAFKVAVLPMVAGLGGLLPGLITGAGFVEVVFSWPGVTPLVLNALSNSDLYVIASVTALSTVLYMVGNLLSDMALAAIDPRIRYN